MTVWTDEGIEPGTPNWQRAIQNAIVEAGCLVGILSPDAAQSDWVWEELNFARTHQKPIFLFLWRGDERSAVPFGFSTFQWVDIRADGQYGPGMARLIGTVLKRLGAEERTQPTPMGTSVVSLQPPDLSGILPPPFEWCEVPAGQVTLTEKGGYLEAPTTFEVGQFWMAKYPITNAQFQVFADAGDGYSKVYWWDYSEDARDWRARNAKTAAVYVEAGDLPRTNVTWYEAVAFCRWLSWKSKLIALLPDDGGELPMGLLSLRLPTEQEWQRAAQGDDGRKYPWGNVFDKGRANIADGGIGKMTTVTQFPDGASPFGLIDMAGNVWEWCLTNWETGRNDPDSNAPRVLRGGSWGDLSNLARCAARGGRFPVYLDIDRGFRVVIVLPTGTHNLSLNR